MSRESEFLIFCLELYRHAKSKSGAEVFDLFAKSGARDYVLKHFESLHTTGNQYILSDIDEFLKNHKTARPHCATNRIVRAIADM